MTPLAFETKSAPRGAVLADRAGEDAGKPASAGGEAAPVLSALAVPREAFGRPDPVDLAALESFPASDPPSWLGISTGAPARHLSKDRSDKEATMSAPASSGLQVERRRQDLPPYPVSVGGTAVVELGAQGRAVRIYRPARSVMQAGHAHTRKWLLEFEPRWAPEIEPLMGWTGSQDTLQQVKLTFPSKEQAVAFAERQGWTYRVVEPHELNIRPKRYGDNFRWRVPPAGQVAATGRTGGRIGWHASP